MYDVDVYIDDHADDVDCFILLPRWIMLINAELNVHLDDIHVYIVAQVDVYGGDLNVHMFMFILMLRWVDERKEQEEVEALREEVSGEEIKLIF